METFLHSWQENVQKAIYSFVENDKSVIKKNVKWESNRQMQTVH